MLLQTCPLLRACLSPAAARQRGRGGARPPARRCPAEPRLGAGPAAGAARGGAASGGWTLREVRRPLPAVSLNETLGCGSPGHLPPAPGNPQSRPPRAASAAGSQRGFPLPSGGDAVSSSPREGPRGAGRCPGARRGRGLPAEPSPAREHPPRPRSERQAQAARLTVAASLPRCDCFPPGATRVSVGVYRLVTL